LHGRLLPERIWIASLELQNVGVPRNFFWIRRKCKQGLNNNDIREGKKMIGPPLIFDKSFVGMLNPVQV
jgi:hypothetical protein